MKEFKDFTLNDFFNFLEKRKSEIVVLNAIIKKSYNSFNLCCKYDETLKKYFCYANSISDMLKNNATKQKFKEVLIDTYGSDFFDIDEKEIKKRVSEDYYTTIQFSELFNNVAHLRVPTDFDSFVTSVEYLCKSSTYNTKHAEVLNDIQRRIASRYITIYKANYNQMYAINKIEKILELYKAKKEIAVNDDLNRLSTILNECIVNEYTTEDGKIVTDKIDFGVVTIAFILEYNHQLYLDKIVRPKVNTYYKTITKTPLEELKNRDFPKYSDKDVVEIFRMLDDKFTEKIQKCKNDKKKDELIELQAITQMNYAGYFTSKYYDEEKVFGIKNK